MVNGLVKMNSVKKLKSTFKWSLLSASIFLVFACDSQDAIEDALTPEDVVCEEDTTDVDFKQIAYWSENDDETLEDIDFSRLTHIIYDQIAVSTDG